MSTGVTRVGVCIVCHVGRTMSAATHIACQPLQTVACDDKLQEVCDRIARYPCSYFLLSPSLYLSYIILVIILYACILHPPIYTMYQGAISIKQIGHNMSDHEL